MTLALYVTALGITTFSPPPLPDGLAIGVLVVAFNGLCCGLYGSAIGRSVLGGFGWALIANTVAGVVLGVANGIISSVLGKSEPPDAVVAVVATAVSALMLDLSARRFGRLDRQRSRLGRRGVRVGELRSLVWVTWRQGRAAWWTAVVGGAALAMIVPVVAPHLWPIFGLALGVILGTGTFGADQAGKTFGFLGDRRMSPGRVWLVKQGIRISPFLVVLAIYFASGYLRTLAANVRIIDHSSKNELIRVLGESYGFALGLFGLLSGYAIAQFLGMACRKEAVAAVIAILVATGLGVLWLPSLVIGGVHWWQWLAVPVILLVATRLATWPWMTGRLASWKPALGLTAAVVSAVAATAGGIAYRVFEAPVRAAPFNVATFEANFPTPEQNRAGRSLVDALHDLERRLTSNDTGRLDRRGVPSN
ncbi:MAG TPA: hypothetical protein VH120_05925, partial [Gemmataceae bacterium]|nr:hypothetical protein [Gemmataceae bacterium]